MRAVPRSEAVAVWSCPVEAVANEYVSWILGGFATAPFAAVRADST